MSIVDRRGVSVDATDTAIAGDPNPGLAIKAPVRVATTAAITLSGLQTIDGVALAAGDRVLVKDQADQRTNGIYNAATGLWQRTIDATSNDQWTNGTQVIVTSGTVNIGGLFRLTTADPITIGTSNLTFTDSISAALLPTPTATTLGGVKSLAAVTHQFLTSIGTDGAPTQAQPAFSDLSGSIAASQLIAPTASTLGGVKSLAAVTHQFLTSIGTDGLPTQAQPAFTDISGGAALTKTDDTNVTLTLGGSAASALLAAASITVGWTGTLALSRLAPGTDGQLIVGQTSASPLYKTLSGDGALSAAGALTVTKTGGVAFASSATTDATNASNINSGTLSTARLSSNQVLGSIEFIIDGGGSTITTGVTGYLEVPFACTITQATLLGDQSGSIVVNIWKCTYAQFDSGTTHPVSGDKITASAPPTISAAKKAQDSTLTGWTTNVAAGDILAFNVDSVTSMQRVTLSLKVQKT